MPGRSKGVEGARKVQLKGDLQEAVYGSLLVLEGPQETDLKMEGAGDTIRRRFRGYDQEEVQGTQKGEGSGDTSRIRCRGY